jgi:hypothetical protein
VGEDEEGGHGSPLLSSLLENRLEKRLTNAKTILLETLDLLAQA